MAADCVFCSIVEGSIPATLVYEDDNTIAFMDRTQTVPGHVLIVPRQHAANLFEVDPEAYARLFTVTAHLARAVKAALNPPAISVLQNNGREAGQTVDHLHVHILTREARDGYRMNWDDIHASAEQLERWAASIRENLLPAIATPPQFASEGEPRFAPTEIATPTLIHSFNHLTAPPTADTISLS